MKCLIVEDEQHAADYLGHLISQSDFEVEVAGKIDTVAEAVLWLSENDVDIIFLDIQLGDGNGFNIFEQKQLKTPIIFTTSHSNYALEAFKLNTIDYLLKPIDLSDLNAALLKYNDLFGQPENLLSDKNYKKRFMISLPHIIRVVEVNDIAYFVVSNKHLFMMLNTGEQLLYEGTLDAVEASLNPKHFFRINRQFIIRRNAIKAMHHETRGRVRIEPIAPWKEDLIVSIERSIEFKKWLAGVVHI